MKSQFYRILFAVLAAIGSQLQGLCQEKEVHSLQRVFKDDFLIGAALNMSQVEERNASMTALIVSQFGTLTPENNMKAALIHPGWDRYNFEQADEIVRFAAKHNLKVNAHCLIWHSQLPAFVRGMQDADSVRKYFTDHITTVAGRYDGKVYSWDVVNEALNEDGTLRKSIFQQKLGDDYIVEAFRLAQKAAPHTQLYYNDYNIEHEKKREGVVALVKKIKAAGVRIDGVGIQGHWSAGHVPMEDIEKSILEFSALGVKVMFTELDLSVLPSPRGHNTADVNQHADYADQLNPYVNGLPDSVQTLLADSYAQLFRLFLKYHDKIGRVTFWGVDDGQSWLNGFPVRGRTNYPLLFDRQLQPKRAFYAVIGVHGQVVQPFALSDVRLLESPFLRAQETDAKYILSLNEDRLLAPFLKDAGLTPLAPNYGNWESQGLDGHIAGHYLSAVAQLYAATGDTVYRNRLEYMLGWLEKCQDRNGNGYVGGIPDGKGLWTAIAAGKVGAIWSRWAPWYDLHKLYSGLVDAWFLTGNQQAKRIVVRLADWCYGMTSGLSDDQMQQMLGNEHGGMNEVFANLSVITGDEKYMTLARRFSHQAILRPLERGEDSLTGLHANTQIPKVTGFMRIGMITGDSSWEQAAKFFWTTVTKHRSVVFGGNSVREHFNPADDFSPMLESREGPETCNSYNMLKLTKLLFLVEGSSSYMDYYERTLYNHILSSQDPKGGFVYFTPIRPNHYRVYSTAQESFWCCVGTGMENQGKYGELIYAHSGDALYVNLFIPSVVNWKEKGLVLTQRTSFPFEERTRLTVSVRQSQRLVVKLRRPSWLGGEEMVTVNGKRVMSMAGGDGYIRVDRVWQNGDVIELSLPMRTRAEALPDGSHWVAFLRGPIVLAAPTGTEDMAGLWADSSRWGHIARGKLMPLDQTPMLAIDDLSTAKPPAGVVPFFQIHESRYIMYWPYAKQADIPGIQAVLKKKEEDKLRKEAATIDMVYPGEQQPESDHAWKGENTGTGFFRERHYRSAKGWFSYQLSNAAGAGAAISFTYYGADGPKRFDVLVNGQKVAGVELAAGGEKEFKDYVVALPEGVKGEKVLTVTFKAVEGSGVPGIYEVRVIRK